MLDRADSFDGPAPAFRFEVMLGGEEIGFTEVDGIDAEIVAGRREHQRITLRRGIFRGDLALWRWFNDHAASGAAQRTVTITLPGMRRWILHGAWPARLIGPALRADLNAVAIETLEIAFEQMEITDA